MPRIRRYFSSDCRRGVEADRKGTPYIVTTRAARVIDEETLTKLIGKQAISPAPARRPSRARGQSEMVRLEKSRQVTTAAAYGPDTFEGRS